MDAPNIIMHFRNLCSEAILSKTGKTISPGDLVIDQTRPEFEGDYTLVVFSLTKQLGMPPEAIAKVLGEDLLQRGAISAFNVVKGFLNCTIGEDHWVRFLRNIYSEESYGRLPRNGRRVLVEYASPNTNKPLHLGHIRNILLGWSTAQLLDEVGYEVMKVQVINDRGIAICKSMLAWKMYGDGDTPRVSGTKGDHFVGNYYVQFENKFQEEYQEWQRTEVAKELFSSRSNQDENEKSFFRAYKNEYFNKYSPLGQEAKEMLLKWESGDSDTVSLWKQMNDWVYEGFEITLHKLGVHFDKNYYESETYLLGKEIVEEGLRSSVFYRKDDGSVWVDLEESGMDHKILLRSDGTSVYMTQDLGTAEKRYQDFASEKMIYVVADEQNYHFQVLFEIAKRMDRPYAGGMHHLSYGMVELPDGRMKSREGNVVDADELIAEIEKEAEVIALEKGEVNNLPAPEVREIVESIALAAIKFFMIKVSPRRKMIFDPKESLDMQGQTGPYIQNAFVRISSVLRRMPVPEGAVPTAAGIAPSEKTLLLLVDQYPYVLIEAAENYDPSHLANYLYKLAKSYHRFYGECPIISSPEGIREFRLMLSETVGRVLKRGMELLGMAMPSKM